MYERIIAAATDDVWLITEGKLDQIWTFLEAKAAGLQLDAQTIEMAVQANRERRKPVTRSAVGVIPIVGTISQRVSLLEEASGGVSTASIDAAFSQAMADDEIGSIVFDVDSPGGTYPGIPELADKIYAARGDGKPIVAQVNAEAGSGGLWLASAAQEVVITPSGQAGSIGAYVRHEDVSQLNESVGIKRRYISYGKYKTEGNPDEPLTDEAEQEALERVTRVGREFEAAIAKFRGVPVEKVRKEFGQGRMLDAKAAVAVGMVDRISTFESTIRRFATGRARPRHRVENAKRRLRI